MADKRLIDADGSYTLNAADNTGYSLAFGGGIISVADEWGHIIAEFHADDAPTVDAVPVVRGEWISLTDCANAGVYCSVCHKKVWKEDYAWCNRKNKLRSNYCPNCGAKMDGGAEDGKAD